MAVRARVAGGVGLACGSGTRPMWSSQLSVGWHSCTQKLGLFEVERELKNAFLVAKGAD